MGRGEHPKDYTVPEYAPWRQLTKGGGPVVIAVGPLAGIYIDSFQSVIPQKRPNLWAVSELPLSCNPLPEELISQIGNSDRLCVAEEHVQHGGFGSELLLYLAQHRIAVPRFFHLFARAHCFDSYGSQAFLREKSAIDAASMLAVLEAA